MTKTIKLALVAAMAMGATSAFATNGDQLIGLGAKSRAMGGTGIAHYNGAESGLSNPALIANVQGTEFSFGGTYFHPSVEFARKDGSGAAPGDYDRSEASHNVIPEVSLAHNIGNGIVIGVGMFGTAGMGTDYRDGGAFNAFKMRTSLQLMKFAVPIAYKVGDFSVGIAPVLQYGALDINYVLPAGFGGAPSDTTVGNGVSQDFGIGFELGAAYQLKDLGLTIGAKYTSAISMTYEDQISGAVAPFGGFGVNTSLFTDELEEPARIGLGIDWTQGDISVTADYTQIKYGSAAGYDTFNWEDQDVFALGFEYRMDALALRAGYNYASNCVQEADGNTQTGAAINFFNISGFPAITESHYTAGLGYAITKNVTADFAFTYAPEVDESYSTVGLFGPGSTVSVNHKQYGVSAALTFNF